MYVANFQKNYGSTATQHKNICMCTCTLSRVNNTYKMIIGIKKFKCDYCGEFPLLVFLVKFGQNYCTRQEHRVDREFSLTFCNFKKIPKIWNYIA